MQNLALLLFSRYIFSILKRVFKGKNTFSRVHLLLRIVVRKLERYYAIHVRDCDFFYNLFLNYVKYKLNRKSQIEIKGFHAN